MLLMMQQEVPDEAAAVSPAANTASMKQIYQGVLQSVQNQEAGYTFFRSGSSDRCLSVFHNRYE